MKLDHKHDRRSAERHRRASGRLSTGLALLFWLLLLLACDLPHQPGPQPTTIIDTEFEPGLNIIGILRLDNVPGSSQFRVERAFLTEEQAEDFSAVVTDAEVVLLNVSTQVSDTFFYEIDSLRDAVYLNRTYLPVGGATYHLTITAPGLPMLTAVTTVPPNPVLDSTSWVVSSQAIAFDIITTDRIDLYDIYLVSEQGQTHQRLVATDDPRLPVLFQRNPQQGQPLGIDLYGYDPNLAEYLTASIPIKPQTYLQSVNTVEGGYGCFGAVSRQTITLPE